MSVPVTTRLDAEIVAALDHAVATGDPTHDELVAKLSAFSVVACLAASER